jgi:hypothetical protein
VDPAKGLLTQIAREIQQLDIKAKLTKAVRNTTRRLIPGC